MNTAPPLHLTTARHRGSDGLIGLGTAVSGFALNADPDALRRDLGGFMGEILHRSAALEATPSVSPCQVAGDHWYGMELELDDVRAWSGHRDGTTVTLVGPGRRVR